MGLNSDLFFLLVELDLQNLLCVLQNEWSLDNKGIKGSNSGQDDMCDGGGWNGHGVLQVRRRKA